MACKCLEACMIVHVGEHPEAEEGNGSGSPEPVPVEAIELYTSMGGGSYGAPKGPKGHVRA